MEGYYDDNYRKLPEEDTFAPLMVPSVFEVGKADDVAEKVHDAWKGLFPIPQRRYYTYHTQKDSQPSEGGAK